TGPQEAVRDASSGPGGATTTVISAQTRLYQVFSFTDLQGCWRCRRVPRPRGLAPRATDYRPSRAGKDFSDNLITRRLVHVPVGPHRITLEMGWEGDPGPRRVR